MALLALDIVDSNEN